MNYFFFIFLMNAHNLPLSSSIAETFFLFYEPSVGSLSGYINLWCNIVVNVSINNKNLYAMHISHRLSVVCSVFLVSKCNKYKNEMWIHLQLFLLVELNVIMMVYYILWSKVQIQFHLWYHPIYLGWKIPEGRF